MSSVIGNKLKLTLFGQSHGEAVGAVIDGLPCGIKLDFEFINGFLQRRKADGGSYSTKRIEADEPVIVSGVSDGVTNGSPLCVMFKNNNVRKEDYNKGILRPSHADFTALTKHGKEVDISGGGHFSGRLMLPLCFAGAICLKLLEEKGIYIYARLKKIGNVSDDEDFELNDVKDKKFKVKNEAAAEEMKRLIDKAAAEKDSIGGVIECKIEGVRAGYGDPIFESVESKIAHMMFSIPAIKGIEFGSGFSGSEKRGSQNNDEFFIENGKVVTKTNNSGGILGGITNGMPIVFRVAVKPTASIGIEQNTVDFFNMKEIKHTIVGRHDACITVRALACVEAAAALCIYEII